MGEYFLSILVGAMVCGIILSMVPEGTFRSMIKLMCGFFLTISLVYPLTNIDFPSLTAQWHLSDFQEGEAIAAMGKENSHNLLAARIKQETEEYILDKAAAMGLSLGVEVILEGTDVPAPVFIHLSGTPDVAARQELSQWITEELGISKENQLWTEANSARN